MWVWSLPGFLLCRFFSSVHAVLQGACHMVAMQISAEPLVRQALRQVFQSRALLSVKPTKKGKKVWWCASPSLPLPSLPPSFPPTQPNPTPTTRGELMTVVGSVANTVNSLYSSHP